MELPISQTQNEGMKPSILLPSLLVMNAAFAADPVLRIRLIDEASLTRQTHETFESKAHEILTRAGVESDWLDCPAKPSPDMPADCIAPLTRTDLVIRILPRTMIGHDNGLGSSVASHEGGVYGLIYYPSVELLAKILDVPIPVILALATVHEIGYLVLGNDAHWPAGIMHPRWDLKEVTDMVQMNHYFNKSQSREFQKRLIGRELSR